MTGISSGEARLIYATGHGSRSLPVNYCWSSGKAEKSLVTLRLPEYNDAVHYVDDQDVVIELPPSLSREQDEPMRVGGHATVVSDARVPDVVAARLEQWPAGVISRFITVSVPTPAPRKGQAKKGTAQV